jgi:hypothetical protein
MIIKKKRLMIISNRIMILRKELFNIIIYKENKFIKIFNKKNYYLFKILN